MGEPLALATRNRDKIREIAELLAGRDIPLVTFLDVAGWPEVEETGSDFLENALLKARAISEVTGTRALAEDSGLEVTALGGAPGILSARYAGTDGDYEANNRKLLQELAGRGPREREARFVCVAVLVEANGTYREARGIMAGRIAQEPAGAAGFGYDPVFIPEGMDRTVAQLSPDEKNAISHRGKALRQLLPYL
ncbi:MAG: RdgB/HAM1 family non-canonical purine NTP pyrophosphatase [Candidatus Geothermincolia bacterium]